MLTHAVFRFNGSCFRLPHFCIEAGTHRWDYCHGKIKQKEILSGLHTSYFLLVESFNWIKMENVLWSLQTQLPDL